MDLRGPPWILNQLCNILAIVETSVKRILLERNIWLMKWGRCILHPFLSWSAVCIQNVLQYIFVKLLFSKSPLTSICWHSQLSVQLDLCRETPKQDAIFTGDLICEIPVSCLSYLFPANNPRNASDATQRCFSALAPPLKRKSENNFPLLTAGHLWGV